ncbi:MAG TPA: gas vesicle protein [Methylococcus sp.]|nr:gas vesicle protein [Methylococcus sp.]
MSIQPRTLQHATDSATLADLLERILDKGIVIAGDIRVNLVQVELLTIQLRLVVCSVDKAKEIGLDWWNGHPAFQRSGQEQQQPLLEAITGLERRLMEMETRLPGASPPLSGDPSKSETSRRHSKRSSAWSDTLGRWKPGFQALVPPWRKRQSHP